MYLLDANVFIQCHNFNPPSIFVTQWQWFANNALGVCSIDEVFDELSPSNAVLHGWAKQVRTNGYFLSSKSRQVQDNFKKVTSYVVAQYKDSDLRDKFLNGADGWLVAMGMANNHEILTFEKRVGANNQKPKIPNVADEFGVKSSNFFDFCNNHNVQF